MQRRAGGGADHQTLTVVQERQLTTSTIHLEGNWVHTTIRIGTVMTRSGMTATPVVGPVTQGHRAGRYAV